MQLQRSRRARALRLRALREERILVFPTLFTQDALARRVGVSTRQLQRWEAGEQSPHRRHAVALAKELGVAPQDLWPPS